MIDRAPLLNPAIERTNAGLAAAKKRGRVGGRPKALTDDQRRECVALRLTGMTLAEIGAVYGVGTSIIDRAVKEVRAHG
jgi:DNA invertase Pin-like site-specific DNA recombinase